MASPTDLDELDRSLLNELQREIPHTERPFLAVAERAGTSEEEVLSRLARMKTDGVVRQVLSIFDTPSLGYKSTLAALSVPRERIEEVAAIVNAHPGVSHDYERDHAWNLWFTLAVPPGREVEGDVRALARIAGVGDPLLLPTLKLYKIGVRLDMTAGEAPPMGASEGPPKGASEGPPRESDGDDFFRGSDRGEVRPLTEAEVRFVQCLQEDMPIVARPYDEMARRCGLSESQVLDAARGFRERGVLRRTAAILRHRRAGFGANGMGIWAVAEARWDEVGEGMAAFRAVSHCYRRPSGPGWPYTHFTMIHGKTRDEVVSIVEEIAGKTGIEERSVLFSTREFKKTRLRFFTSDDARWHEEHADAFLPREARSAAGTS